MTLTATLHTAPAVPLEAEALSPAALAGLDAAAAARLPVLHGNERTELGTFFRLHGRCDDGRLVLEGDLGRVKYVGCGLSAGHVRVEGDVGAHLGAGMSGGLIEVRGNAGDWVGPAMSGGRIHVHGSAGHMVGAAFRGAAQGITGGEILVDGDVGNEVGNAMRRGLIAVGGRSGDFPAVNLLAGTVLVAGPLGARPGAGMRRGTLIGLAGGEPLPTFGYACRCRPVFLRLLAAHLAAAGFPLPEGAATARYRRYAGDAVELNRGELLLRD